MPRLQLLIPAALLTLTGILTAQLTQPMTKPQPIPPSTRKSPTVKSQPFLSTAPITVEMHLLDPDHHLVPKTYDGEGGCCETQYHSDLTFENDLPTAKPTGKDFTATLKCNEPWAKITLHFNLWLPANSPAWLTDHEETHRAISERVYAEAIPKLSALLKQMNNKTYEAHGPTEGIAKHNAHQAPLDEFNQAYTRLLTAREARLNNEFDRITQHGADPPKSNKEIMEDIFKADAESSATTTAPAK